MYKIDGLGRQFATNDGRLLLPPVSYNEFFSGLFSVWNGTIGRYPMLLFKTGDGVNSN